MMKEEIYKQLYEIYSSFYLRVFNRAKNIIDYPGKDQNERMKELIEFISDESRHDYCGLITSNEKIILKTLKALLDKEK